jgi:hypothetical protein
VNIRKLVIRQYELLKILRMVVISMAIVRMHMDSLIKLGLWEKVCEYKGWSHMYRWENHASIPAWVEFDDSLEKPIKYVGTFNHGLHAKMDIESQGEIREGQILFSTHEIENREYALGYLVKSVDDEKI